MGNNARNVLFIMCDQLRWDFLSCYGHPVLETPNIDRLAKRGVRFTRAYVQSPVCGSSRMSFYTGRYASSHGATWNNIPMRVGERTLGDYLRPLGVRTALVGKTHMYADKEGMAWLGLDPDSVIGTQVGQCGFEPYERDDGLHPTGPGGAYNPDRPRYNDYLNDEGFEADNPWDDWANAGEDEDGALRSGWFLRNAVRPARVPEEHSETPYMTRRAMDFIDEAADQPWCLHLSYIKPHWPYIVPAPYHEMFGPDDVLPAVRSDAEKEAPHPVLGAFQDFRVSKTFSRDEVRAAVIPAYMGLIKQVDDQIGRLLDFLEARGLMETTMIVFTSDHGDYLGDHWLGEKDLFHDCVSRIPLIVCDPRDEADAARGTSNDALVEAIDLAPTFLDFFGGPPQPHRLEGRALTPLLAGDTPADWRRYVVSETDYSMLPARRALGIPVSQARMTMIATERWKYIHAEGFRPMLYDLVEDPQELVDLGADNSHETVRREMAEMHFEWARRVSQRVTKSDAEIEAMAGKNARRGILLGFWDETDLPPELQK